MSVAIREGTCSTDLKLNQYDSHGTRNPSVEVLRNIQFEKQHNHGSLPMSEKT